MNECKHDGNVTMSVSDDASVIRCAECNAVLSEVRTRREVVEPMPEVSTSAAIHHTAPSLEAALDRVCAAIDRLTAAVKERGT